MSAAQHTTGVMQHAALMGTINTGFRDEAIFHCGLGIRHNSFINEQEANARRLVACWNACEGVPVEVLEGNAAGGLPWNVADQIEFRVERDQMLEALRRLHDWAQAQAPNTDFSGDHPIAIAREMLRAKTTGGAS
ncbi:hypothetical protein [Variovorax sp. V15]|uniref:hypothetical protein n=1 Tax=Variovorax sp. V15 TaxID=3065952 RepID=UPI0034E8BC4A